MKFPVRSELPLAAGIVALGVTMLAAASDVSFGAGYDRIGPRFFPLVVAGGLILLGAALAFSHSPAEDAAPLHIRPLAYIGLGLVLYTALLDRAGFVIASTAQFWLVARGFHSQRPARDLAVAIVLALVVYVMFSNALGLTLPAGLLEGVL